MLQKFESADYGDESPRMVVHIKPKSGASTTTPGGSNKRSGNTTNVKAMRQPEEVVFDIGKERNKGNQFWKQGKGREEHRALEMVAKSRRQKSKIQGIAKVQILEENLSDEVSPGVTRTMSPQITPKSLKKDGANP